MARTYRELLVWQRAMNLVELVYTASGRWPREELYGLTSQIRRASVSVPSNIAEGQGRNSNKEFINHLSIARGSLLELETQVLIAERLRYVDAEATRTILAASAEVGRLLSGLATSLGRATRGKPAGN